MSGLYNRSTSEQAKMHDAGCSQNEKTAFGSLKQFIFKCTPTRFSGSAVNLFRVCRPVLRAQKSNTIPSDHTLYLVIIFSNKYIKLESIAKYIH